MIFKRAALLSAIFAVAVGNFNTTKLESIAGKMVRLGQKKYDLNKKAGVVIRYLVLLIDEKDNDKTIGTGYIVTLNSIITLSKNLENVVNRITFNLSGQLGGRKCTIIANKPYDKLLSVARFKNPINKDKEDLISRLPVLPTKEILTENEPAMTLGFAKNKRRCMVPSDITQCTEKMYYAGSTLKNENSHENYYPRLGDVLIINDFIVGIMVQFQSQITFVSGEYYSHTYPSEDDFAELENIPSAST